MADSREHPYIPTLKRQLAERTLDRREFLRTATLLGMSAGAAYAFAGKVTGERLVPAAEAQTPPKGGDVPARHAVPGSQEPAHLFLGRIRERRAAGARLSGRQRASTTSPARPGREVGGEPRSQDLDAPHPAQRQVAQRPGVHGRRRRLEPQARARRQDGLLGGGPHEGVHPRGVRDRREGRQGQREEVDAAVGRQRHREGRRLHRRSTARRRSSPFPSTSSTTRCSSWTRRRTASSRWAPTAPAPSRWSSTRSGEAGLQGEARLLGRRPVSRKLEFIDLGDDAGGQGQRAGLQAGRRAIPGRHRQLEALEKLPHLQLYQVDTAYTAVARMHPIKPFDDKRVRQALRYAIDSESVLQVAHRGLGKPGEHHHVRPVHPEYAKMSASSGTSPRRRSCWPKPATRTGSMSRSRAARSPTGSCSRCRRWSSNGRRPASASRST